MFVRFLLVFDSLFILLRIAQWPSAGKELSLGFSLIVFFFFFFFFFSAVLVVCVFFPFVGQGVEFDCVGS